MPRASRLPLLAALLPAALSAQGPPGGGGPMQRGDMEVVARFDRNGDKRLDAAERAEARAWVKENRPRRGRGGPGGGPAFGPPGEPAETAVAEQRGQPLRPADAAVFAGRPFYDTDTVRTLFLTFPQADWFQELSEFYRTDVDLPANLLVDGVEYRDVGVNFRGNSSYGTAGKKKSLHLSFDHADAKQRVMGYRSTNLINSHEDPTFLREALGAWIAGRHTHALKANLVRLCINGEDFGIYCNLQHFNKDFLDEQFGSSKGARWKVPPDFSGQAGLRDLGDDDALWRRSYDLKSEDDPKAWQRLKDLCRLLEHGSDAEVLLQLPGYLDIDEALWFLAVDNALLDGDGYYSRGSDYSLWLDKENRFHVLARDGNEVLGAGGGPGGPGGRGRRGPRSGDVARGGDGARPRADGTAPAPGDPAPPDGPRGERGQRGQRGEQGPPDGAPPGTGPGGRRGPGGFGPGGGGMRQPEVNQPALAMKDDPNRPLIRRLLGQPAWQQRYLWFLRTLASTSLDWSVAGPRIAAWQQAITGVVQTDVHALYGFDAFTRALADQPAAPGQRTLRGILDARRAALLGDPVLQGAWPSIAGVESAWVGAPGRPQQLRVTARVGGDNGPGRLTLHYGLGRLGQLIPVPMYDDGEHGDGRADDGLFATTTGDLEPGKAVRFYVEAANAGGRVACEPASGGVRPMTLEAPGQQPKDKNKDKNKDKDKDKDKQPTGPKSAGGRDR